MTEKGQVSTEFLVIVAVVLLIFIPLLVMVYFKAAEANEQISNYQAELTVFRMAYMANSIGNLGKATVVYTDVYLPGNVKSFEIRQLGNGGEILMVLATGQGDNSIVEIIRPRVAENVSMKNPRQGWMRFRIENTAYGGEPAVRITKS